MASSSGVPKVQKIADAVKAEAEFFFHTDCAPGDTTKYLPKVIPFEHYTPIGATTQAANGTNWFIKMQVRVKESKTDDYIQLRVHEDRNGRVKLTGMLKGPSAAGPARSFDEGFVKQPLTHDEPERTLPAKKAEPIDNQVRLAFEKFDTNDSGAISSKEIAGVLKELGVEPKSTTCIALLNKYDADGNRTLNLSEFNNMYKELRSLLGVKKTDTQKYATGQMYTGEYVDGLFHGKGTFTFLDGSVYKGEWQNGLKHGKGFLKTAKGDIYSGEWSCGSPKKLSKHKDQSLIF
mmetsp:Transcript_58951/g.81052  ORF Transcript_58951/g.81052 Transcript_58951/m.81052 type:complete len:291 (-) Transcript_58951:254-1126(-)|eukprot:scaffold151536_cov33-Tisochrysis_lutea.AAC.1